MAGKAPIVGVVSYVSKNGAEIHLEDDDRRYRGSKTFYSQGHFKTVPIGIRATRPGHYSYTQDGKLLKPRYMPVLPGHTVRMHWGGFANLNISRVEILD